MGAIFTARGEAFVDRITHQSFDVGPHPRRGPSRQEVWQADIRSGKQSLSPNLTSRLFELLLFATRPPVRSSTRNSLSDLLTP